MYQNSEAFMGYSTSRPFSRFDPFMVWRWNSADVERLEAEKRLDAEYRMIQNAMLDEYRRRLSEPEDYRVAALRRDPLIL